mmetsp:Transcript_21797/g.24233  ORF Transcript_21797/g.24233 Transcript_21797/m.24233 type:complete len:172 (+) Transcript_21797:36-551(+)|eukprot:CAMPEP_0205805450 /NCGR_PEP_ID=MMETSP0205-20121125/8680_1 /ASSEMBLY_ACC=CAM_ASM_000278 /TAXON_ID=36767 /ORGANISM="Euplotes focardii, Strain TN1" /LENGTH=171 /DNA_ID=CAMNT_0053076693 /DNA_START=8 /DNA_END=526 /DNA_ORIENTATION=+
MKYCLVFILLLAVAYSSFDFTHHQNGHELFTSLRDETQKIWVVFVEAHPEGNDEVRTQNKDVKAAVKNMLTKEDVFYTELELTTDEQKEKYQDFIDLTKLDTDLLNEGPTVVLVYDKKGNWIHGHGIPQETVDTIHAFILQKEENDNRNQPISVGGSVQHPSAFESFGGGY